MTQKDWLEVGIRVIGVYVLFTAVTYFAESALMYADYSRNPDINFRYYLIHGWVYGFAGLFFLKAPAILSNYAYPAESDDTSGEAGEATDEKATE